MGSNDETELTPAVPGFAVQRLLGVGGGSAVWLMRVQRRTGRFAQLPEEVALKVPHQRQPGSAALADIRAELRAMEPLRHDHIVRTYGAVETSQGAGLLLEAYGGGPLSGVIRAEGGLSPGQLVTAAMPVAQALAHLHAQGAVHGDVSPGNILLAPDGRPALADLGEAQLLGMPRTARGTAGFLAPEHEDLIHGAGQEDPRRLEAQLAAEADVYSLGAVCWFALTGEPPAPGRERAPLSTGCPEVPPRLTALLEEALSALPEDRPTAAEFAHGLYGAARPEPLDLSAHVDDEVLPELPTRLPESRPGPLERVREGLRPRTGAAVSAILLAAGLGAGAWFWWPGAEGEAEAGAEKAAAETPGSEDPRAEDELLQAIELLGAEDVRDALEGLQTLRTAALRDPAPEPPGLYAAPESPALTAEQELMEALVREGISYSGPALQLEPVGEPLQTPEGRTAVQTRVTAQDFHSQELHTQEVVLVMERAEGRWLLYEVEEMAEPEETAG